VIIYEMLTGKVPFDGESPGEILMKHLTVAPDLTRLPLAYRGVVARLLAKDPLQRYSSFKAMLADLEGYVAAPPSADAWAETAAPTVLPVSESPSPSVMRLGNVAPAGAKSELGFLWYLGATITSIAAAVVVGVISGFSVATVAFNSSTERFTAGGGADSSFAVGVALGIFSALLTLGLSMLIFQRWARAIRFATQLHSSSSPRSRPSLSGFVKVLLGFLAGLGGFFLFFGLTFSDLGGAGALVGLGLGFLAFGFVTYLLFRLDSPQAAPLPPPETPRPGATWAGQESSPTGSWPARAEEQRYAKG
jgi:hypothetical protein